MAACGLLCLSEVFCLLLSLICTPVYLIFMISIIYALKEHKSKRFLSFYWLLLSAGVADIWYLLNYYILNRFSRWGWLQWPFTYGGDWLPWWSTMGTWYLKQSQVLAVFFMAINRLCAICWPLKYKVQWDGPFTLKVIASQWCLALLVVVPAAVKCEIGVAAFVNGTRETFVKNNNVCGSLMFGVQTVVQLVIVMALIVMYMLMYAQMKKQAKKDARTKQLDKKLQERKAQQHLAVAGGLISIVLALYACSTATIPVIVFKLKIAALTPILVMIQGLLSTALSVINPFVLVAICENLRKSFVKVCRKAVRKDAPSITIKPGTKSRKENEQIEIK